MSRRKPWGSDGTGSFPAKRCPPTTDVSVQTTDFIESDGFTHGPPDELQPLQLESPTASPSRRASASAWRSISIHSSEPNATGPSGMPAVTSKMNTPPIPTRAIDSRSAVMPALVTLPFIQCHHTCGLAERGGVRNPFTRTSSADASATIPAAHASSATAPRKRLFVDMSPIVPQLRTKWGPITTGRNQRFSGFGKMQWRVISSILPSFSSANCTSARTGSWGWALGVIQLMVVQ